MDLRPSVTTTTDRSGTAPHLAPTVCRDCQQENPWATANCINCGSISLAARP